MTHFPSKLTSTFDSGYCEAPGRDPGGSRYCPSVSEGDPIEVYELTYSYSGEPLVSDEHGDRHFSFRVYFRSEELTAAAREAVAGRKLNHANAPEFFVVSTNRDLVEGRSIDEARSRFCEGSYVDGLWTTGDSNCNDEITYKAAMNPSAYYTVKVDPLAALSATKER